MIKFLDLYRQYETIKPEIDAAIRETIEAAAFIGGPAVRRFEDDFAAFQQAAHCVGTANGTDALEIALEGLGLPVGGEVIVPANSFIATAEAVTRSRLDVVFADVDPGTYALDLEDVERRVTSRTVAVIAVHLYGHPAEMNDLLALARRHDLRLLEDAAQAHGAEYRGRRVGALADVGTFSFYPGKNLGAYGDAGAIVTNDESLASRCRLIANHGRLEKYDHVIEGRNSRLDSLQAAILNVKLRHLEGWIDRRNVIADRYRARLADIQEIELPVVAPHVRHAFHLFVVRVPDRDRLASHLLEQGVQTGVHYPIALPRLPAYAHLPGRDEVLRANAMAENVLSLPIGEHLSDADVDYVAELVRRFFH